MRRAWLVLALLAAQGVSAQAQPGDWTVQRDPFDRTVIARYKAILSRTPHDRMALSALVSLYKRHRSIDLLVREYEATPDAAGTVVLARIARSRGDNRRARELLERAVAMHHDDGAAWLALGELAVAASDHKAARAAFSEAVALADAPAQKQAALRALGALTIAARDVTETERVFDQLAVLRPRDGLLWTERGDALLELARFDGALAAYAKAEALLARDPERKLLAISARGRVFDRAGKTDLAIAEYDRAIAASPRGYYLRRELTLRIVELVRRTSIDRAVREAERRWPEAQRDAFEWSTLADLYEGNGDPTSQTGALQAAARKAPRDAVIQWKLVRHFDRKQWTAEALAALEAAVRASPTDVALVIELAQRLALSDNTLGDTTDSLRGNTDDARPAQLLARLSRAHPRDADAHAAIGEVYARWKHTAAAVREYKLAAKLEPDDNRLVALGDAYAEDGKLDDAIVTWRRLGASGTAKGLARLATVLADHELWDDAINAYTAAMMKDDKNQALWRGRGLAFAELGHWASAIGDAEHAVTLLGGATFEQGYETRVALIRILDRSVEDGVEDTFANSFGDDLGEDEDARRERNRGISAMRTHILQWGKAFRQARPDIGAGYMLAAYFARHSGSGLVTVLLRLKTLVPTDEGIVVELIRAYRLEHRYDDAVAVARGLAAKHPARAVEMGKLIASIAVDRKLHLEDEAQRRLEQSDELDEPTGVLQRWTRRGVTGRVPLVAGARLGLGVGLGGTTERSLTLGSWDAVPITNHLDAILRADWVQRVGDMRSVNAVALGLGIARNTMVSTHTAIVAAATLRSELRVGELAPASPWQRWAFAADASVDVVSRHLPAAIGLRWEKGLGDPGSTILVEVSAGFRCLSLSGGSDACR